MHCLYPGGHVDPLEEIFVRPKLQLQCVVPRSQSVCDKQFVHILLHKGCNNCPHWWAPTYVR